MELQKSFALLIFSLWGAFGIKLSDEPDISELRSFAKIDGKSVNLAAEIGEEYRHVGACLLKDSDGSKVDAIVAHLGNNPELVNSEILQEWSLGKGRQPVEWLTLLDCLREVSLYELEGEIKEEMEDVPDKDDKEFKKPRSKVHLSVHDDSHPVEDEHQLLAALSEISDWEGVCTNMGTTDSHLEDVRRLGNDPTAKKEACLMRYFRGGQADWSHVVVGVAEPPLSNKRVACKIAHNYMGMDRKECHTFLGMDHDEL